MYEEDYFTITLREILNYGGFSTADFTVSISVQKQNSAFTTLLMYLYTHTNI